MMYYRLKNDFALRGWQKIPYALVSLSHGEVTFIDKLMFDALSMCNGKTAISPIMTPPPYMDVIKRAKEHGVIEECGEDVGLLPWQAYHVYPSRYIMQAHWSITGKCNYRCRHCYMSAPDAKFGELSHKECMDIIDQLHECGVLKVSLTGGEALVRKDFWELVDRLLAYGISIETLYSNGKLITPETLDSLERRRIRPVISMSYDGVGWHDWLRGIDGAEDMVMDAFKLCRDRGFVTTAEMCLHEHNKHTIRESINLLASLGVSSVKTVPVSKSGAWIENAGEDTLSIAEVFELYLEYIPHFFEDGAPLDIQLGGFFSARKGAKEYILPSVRCDGSDRAGRFVICDHARHVMYISAEGRILPCMSLSGLDIQEEYPLVTEHGLVKCLTDSTYMKIISTTVDDFFENSAECAECEHRYFCCTGCRASALESGDDFMGPDRAVCAMYKGGYLKRILEVAEGYTCVNYK